MRIANVMFGRSLGGIEQAFLDYCEGLKGMGHEVYPFIHADAKIASAVRDLGFTPTAISNMGEWDCFATWRLAKKFRKLKLDAVIAHGNRAVSLGIRAAQDLCPVIGVAHNYSIRRFVKLDACIAITRDLVEDLVHLEVARKNIYHIPNMIKLDQGFVHSGFQNVPVIGAMGRFVKKKGFKFFIDVIAELKESGAKFKAVIAGDGEEKDFLMNYAVRRNVLDVLEFEPWVTDKKKFYGGIDIFCLPSHEEPFGIVLLEAFAMRVPVVTTDAQGPCDVITAGVDALMVERGDVKGMAEAIRSLMKDEYMARELAKNAYDKIKLRYSMPVVAKQIDAALNDVTARYHRQAIAA